MALKWNKLEARWISHYGALVVMFLAGTSAFVAGRREKQNELVK